MPLPVCRARFFAWLRFILSSAVQFSGAFLLRIFLPNNGVGNKTSDKQHEWDQKVADPSGEGRSGEDWTLILRAVAEKLGFYGTSPPKPDLQGPDVYLDLFSKTLDFATSPHAGRRAISVASGADGRAIAWECIYAQARPGIRDLQKFRRDSAYAIGVIFAQLSNRISDCRLPLDVGPTVAAKLFEIWNFVSGRRTENNQRGMDPHHPECR